MFNLFRKKKKHIQQWEYDVLRAVVEKLPSKFSFLSSQINEEFIIDSVPNEILKNGWKRNILDQNLYGMIKTETPNFNCQIEGIMVYCLSDKRFKEVKLDLYEGILIGYKVEYGMFDLHRIDISGMRTKLIQSKDILKYIAILSNVKSKHLQLKTGFEIEILNKTYYVIKDFEDGNYLSIDEKGGVYGMFHDPFEIEQVSDSVVEFVDKINKGVFSIDKYYESKFK